jgi:hypothetical protein
MVLAEIVIDVPGGGVGGGVGGWVRGVEAQYKSFLYRNIWSLATYTPHTLLKYLAIRCIPSTNTDRNSWPIATYTTIRATHC